MTLSARTRAGADGSAKEPPMLGSPCIEAAVATGAKDALPLASPIVA
jgi:hypothetical protein